MAKTSRLTAMPNPSDGGQRFLRLAAKLSGGKLTDPTLALAFFNSLTPTGRLAFLAMAELVLGPPPNDPRDAGLLAFFRRRTAEEIFTIVVAYEPERSRAEHAFLSGTSERSTYRGEFRKFMTRYDARKDNAFTKWHGNAANRRPIHPLADESDDQSEAA